MMVELVYIYYITTTDTILKIKEVVLLIRSRDALVVLSTKTTKHQESISVYSGPTRMVCRPMLYITYDSVTL